MHLPASRRQLRDLDGHGSQTDSIERVTHAEILKINI